MVDNSIDSKFDQVVKNALSNYESVNTHADWSKMEKMLGTQPATTNLKSPYLIKIVIGVAALGIIYIFYNLLSSPKAPENTNETISQPATENAVDVPTKKAVVIPAPPVPVPTIPTETITPIEDAKPVVIEKKSEPIKVEKIKEETIVIEKNKKKTIENNTKEEKIKPPTKQQKNLKTGNQPVLGNMADSSKGVITKKKEEPTKPAKTTQPDRSIGWGSFLSKTNLDSLKKFQQQEKNDTLKK